MSRQPGLADNTNINPSTHTPDGAEERSSAPAPLLEAHGLVKEYGPTRVVDDVSLTLSRGESLGLVGESGSGKSTVARMLLRLIEPTAGTVRFRGTDLLALRPGALRVLRRHMQIVFQDPYAALNPRMRVRDILHEPLLIHRDDLSPPPQGHREAYEDVTRLGTNAAAAFSPSGARRNPSRAERRHVLATRLIAMLAEVGLDSSALPRFPHQFSGGQRQRINIARALALRPELVVLDEPVSALDVSVGAQVINLLRDLQRTRGLTYLFISHSMPLVRYLCDCVAVMQRGRIVEAGPCLDICERPREPYTQRLLAATPELEPLATPPPTGAA